MLIQSSFCKIFLYLIIHILRIEAKLLIKHFIVSREAKALYAKDFAMAANQPLQIDRQTGCKAKLLDACGQHAMLILYILGAEQALGTSEPVATSTMSGLSSATTV